MHAVGLNSFLLATNQPFLDFLIDETFALSVTTLEKTLDIIFIRKRSGFRSLTYDNGFSFGRVREKFNSFLNHWFERI